MEEIVKANIRIVCVLMALAQCASIYSTDAHSTLEVISDKGGESTSKYLRHSEDSTHRQKGRFTKRLSKKLIHAHFPVISKSMKVGRVTDSEARNIQYQVATQPMFIVGYDATSKKWLMENKTLLQRKNAIGLVVNVSNLAQMDELQEIVGNTVILQPTPGDRLAEHLNIKHYPFYLDNQGVMR